MEQAFAIDRFIEQVEGDSDRKVEAALAKARQVVQDRHRKANKKEHTMEKTQDLKAGMPTSTPTAITTAATKPKAAVKTSPKPAAKKKAVSKPKAKVAAKKAAPKKKAKPAKKVKTNSARMGRARVYTKQLIMELVKQAKKNGMSLKKVVAGRKNLRYVPLLVASRHPSINLNLGELMGTWHRRAKVKSKKK